jgi:hypothetical protein
VDYQSVDDALGAVETAEQLFANRLRALRDSGRKPVREPVAVVERKFLEACDRVAAVDRSTNWIEHQSKIEFDLHSDPAELIDSVQKMVLKVLEPIPPSFDLIKDDLKNVEEELGEPYRDAKRAYLEFMARVNRFKGSETPEGRAYYRTQLASILLVFSGVLRLEMEVARLYRDRLGQQLSRLSNRPDKTENPSVVVSGQDQYSLVLQYDARSIQLTGADSNLFAVLLPQIMLGQASEVVIWSRISKYCGQPRRKGSPHSQHLDSNASEDLDPKTKRRIKKRLDRLRKKLITALGCPPDSCQWLVTKHGEGVHLNTSVAWQLADEVAKLTCGSGPRGGPVNPQDMQDLVVDPQSPGVLHPERGRRPLPRRDTYG